LTGMRPSLREARPIKETIPRRERAVLAFARAIRFGHNARYGSKSTNS
jgi:hypothetical protein